MTETVKIISPIDGSVYAERPVASAAEIEAAVTRARAARHAWSEITVGERAKFLGHFLDALDAAWKNEQLPGSPSDDLPFHGGWVLMLAYELAAQIEPTLRLQPLPLLPQALAVRCPAAIIVDHQLGRTTLVAEAGGEALLDAMQADLDTPLAIDAAPLPAACEEDDRQRFLTGVARIHDHARAIHAVLVEEVDAVELAAARLALGERSLPGAELAALREDRAVDAVVPRRDDDGGDQRAANRQDDRERA